MLLSKDRCNSILSIFLLLVTAGPLLAVIACLWVRRSIHERVLYVNAENLTLNIVFQIVICIACVLLQKVGIAPIWRVHFIQKQKIQDTGMNIFKKLFE